VKGAAAHVREPVAITIRCARPADSDAIVTVLRRSIIELCVDDHHNDPGVLGGWLQNKTASNVCVWIDAPGNFMLIAEGGARGVCGVAFQYCSGIWNGRVLCADLRFESAWTW